MQPSAVDTITVSWSGASAIDVIDPQVGQTSAVWGESNLPTNLRANRSWSSPPRRKQYSPEHSKTSKSLRQEPPMWMDLIISPSFFLTSCTSGPDPIVRTLYSSQYSTFFTQLFVRTIRVFSPRLRLQIAKDPSSLHEYSSSSTISKQCTSPLCPVKMLSMMPNPSLEILHTRMPPLSPPEISLSHCLLLTSAVTLPQWAFFILLTSLPFIGLKKRMQSSLQPLMMDFPSWERQREWQILPGSCTRKMGSRVQFFQIMISLPEHVANTFEQPSEKWIRLTLELLQMQKGVMERSSEFSTQMAALAVATNPSEPLNSVKLIISSLIVTSLRIFKSFRSIRAMNPFTPVMTSRPPSISRMCLMPAMITRLRGPTRTSFIDSRLISLMSPFLEQAKQLMSWGSNCIMLNSRTLLAFATVLIRTSSSMRAITSLLVNKIASRFSLRFENSTPTITPSFFLHVSFSIILHPTSSSSVTSTTTSSCLLLSDDPTEHRYWWFADRLRNCMQVFWYLNSLTARVSRLMMVVVVS